VASVAQSSPSQHHPTFGGNSVKFFIAGGVIALAVAYLVTMGLQGTTVYFLTVSELQARGASASNQILRVGQSRTRLVGARRQWIGNLVLDR
jgi:hypothetical protein